ncbi:hypothetical protein C2G38_2031103 [Gigaspora rosea]|uniref:Uncharacterized protein n=1 Tax=Gigaspora rosea TaxID=44941 RepID=A0A397VS23_9GLOM|nr:hypothetical protein C2G38_2031103 [Gigaspora rosea]
MSEIKKCDNYLNTDSKKFRSLKEEKWREAERRGLIKDKWEEGIILCNKCYMNYVENPLKRTTKRMKISVQEIESIREETQILVNEDVEAVNEEIGMVDLVGAIRTMARFFYDREHVTKKSPIYSYDELQEEFQTNEGLKNFLDQLYLAARPFERTNQTMYRMKKLIVHICYLLASLNNTKINAFKFDLAYYLDSVGTSNEGLETMTNLGVAATSRAVDRKKKKISDAHEKYVENALSKYLNRAFVLNIDDYHNIHVPQQSDSTSTSRPTHMATIVANPCSMAAIPSNGVLNPKFLDGDLIIKHLDERFIISLGIPYHERCQNYIGEYSDDELIEKLTLHSYNDRLVEKKSDRHIQNAILFDFVGGNLKGVEDYTKALQIVYNQESMQEYLSNHVIPIVADWPGQFFIRKAIAHQLLLNNEIIPLFVTSFLPIMGPLHVSLNSRELVYKKNSPLFNKIYKGIFGKKKNLANQLQKEARFMFQNREDNAFCQHFVNSMKYPYKLKQLHMLFRKCAIVLLEIFTKIYEARHLYPLIVSSSDDGINTYKLPSLDYEITDRHFPRGFVTSRKPYTSVLCDYLRRDCTNYTNCSENGIVHACGHGYHNHCLQRCNFNCLICLGYLRDEIKINIAALKVSMRKDLNENEFINESTESTVEDESDDDEAVTSNIEIEDNLLENVKKNFLNIK